MELNTDILISSTNNESLETNHPDEVLVTEQDTVNKNLETEIRVYKMDSMPRGLALIINNSAFQPKSGFSPRHGSDMDVRNLEDLFKYLGFEVFVKENLTKKKIQKCIKKFKRQFKKISPDMCVVSIMSHGRNGKMVDIDGVEMQLQKDVMKHFYGHPFLGKPKPVLFQFCRGDNIDYEVYTMDTAMARKRKHVPCWCYCWFCCCYIL